MYGLQYQLLWHFAMGFLHSPQQSQSRFANRVKAETVTGENQFESIAPQVDGVDYDPNDSDLKFRPLPMLKFDTERVGFQRYGHTWNYALATEDIARIQPEFRGQLANISAASWARFKDRVLAGKSDGDRVTADASGVSVTKTSLPKNFRYAVKDSTASLKGLDVNTLINIATLFAEREVSNPDGSMAMPVCVASHAQIMNLLKDDKYINRDYHAINALVRGDVNGYMGFEFIKTRAVGAVGASSGIYSQDSGQGIELSSTSNYTLLPEGSEKILFCHPDRAFAMGMYPSAAYMNVWQNPNKAGAWEYYFKNVISWKRCQNEFAIVAYASKLTSPGSAPIYRQTANKAMERRNDIYHKGTDLAKSEWDWDPY